MNLTWLSKVKSQAAVYMAAVLEYIVAEVANKFHVVDWPFIMCMLMLIAQSVLCSITPAIVFFLGTIMSL